MVRLFCIFWVAIFAKLFYRHKVYGKEHVPRSSAIIASNHCSFLDPPLIGISSPIEVHFLARATLFKRPAFAWLIRQLNTHPVAPGKENVQTFRMITKLIAKGERVVLFPEGRRSQTGELLKGQLGIGMLVMRSKAVVVPTYTHGTFPIWSRGRRFPKLFGQRTAVVFGTPLDFSNIDLQDKKKSQQEIAETIMETIGNLKSWYLAGAKGTPP